MSLSEIVCLGPVLEVFVVGDDHELGETFEVVAPIFKCSDDGHELLVVNFIVAFGCVHRLRSVCDGMP